jgi:DNA-binding GntR family transcriptional regulator
MARMQGGAPAAAPRPAKETGSARIYAKLREEILSLELAPGTPLDEVSLSERFGLSRSPIREALVRLASEGFVLALPNRSTVVTPINFEGIPKFLDALDLLQRVTTRLAAQYRSDADLTSISKRQEEFQRAFHKSVRTGKPVFSIDANYNFHMAIAESGKNAYFTGFYRRMLDEGRRMLPFHFQYQSLSEKMSYEEVSLHHDQMIEAIRVQDLDAAEAVAHAHAMQFKGRFMQFLDQNVTASMRIESHLGQWPGGPQPYRPAREERPVEEVPTYQGSR